ncbi:MAG: 1-acyl-sn-glycerol-3-phosphate acyltransferase [Dehalococcoidia bacterium]|nr:1-acyl-sn-glycerol-3-phosphate acyltransferase [Dehalococcoidia bacterium]
MRASFAMPSRVPPSAPMTADRPGSPAGGLRTLPGGYFAVGTAREWVTACAAILILFGPARLLLRLAGALPDRLHGRRACRTAERWWARLAVRVIGLRIHIHGLEHIDRDERYVVVSLHEGFADGLALLHLPLSLTAVARDELATFPLLGGQLARGRHLFIRPEKPLETTRTLRREARAAVEAGDSILLFPQGSILGIEVAFQGGAFNLAGRLGRPLLPIVVTGGHRVWEHPFAPTLRTRQSMTVDVLPPVLPGEAGSLREATERRMKQVALASATPPRHFVPARDGFWDDYRYEIDPAFPDLARQVATHRAAGSRERQGRS